MHVISPEVVILPRASTAEARGSQRGGIIRDESPAPAGSLVPTQHVYDIRIHHTGTRTTYCNNKTDQTKARTIKQKLKKKNTLRGSHRGHAGRNPRRHAPRKANMKNKPEPWKFCANRDNVICFQPCFYLVIVYPHPALALQRGSVAFGFVLCSPGQPQ